MSATFRRKASVVLLVASVGCLLLAPAVSFMAGCAGDTKGGSAGNIEHALHYENVAMLFLFVGMSVGAFSILLRSEPAITQRIACSFAWFIFSGVLFWIAAFQLEGLGVQSCFSAKQSTQALQPAAAVRSLSLLRPLHHRSASSQVRRVRMSKVKGSFIEAQQVLAADIPAFGGSAAEAGR